MGWTMRALVWRFTKLFEKRGDHHHRSGEEEPLVERRKEGLALSIKEESESFVTFYQERKWKFCHDNCLSCWVLIVSAWHGLGAKVLAINVQNLVSLLKQLRPGVIIINACLIYQGVQKLKLNNWRFLFILPVFTPWTISWLYFWLFDNFIWGLTESVWNGSKLRILESNDDEGGLAE